MRALQRVGILCAMAFIAGTMSCATPAPGEVPETDDILVGEDTATMMGDEESQDPGAERESDAAACDDADFSEPATIPQQLDDLDVPFYECVHEMVAIEDNDPLFVGEYDTSHESIIIEMSITNQFDASDWEVSEVTVEGDNAVTHAQKPGYSLVVAIGPSRSPEATSSLHYTLRTQ